MQEHGRGEGYIVEIEECLDMLRYFSQLAYSQNFGRWAGKIVWWIEGELTIQLTDLVPVLRQWNRDRLLGGHRRNLTI